MKMISKNINIILRNDANCFERKYIVCEIRDNSQTKIVFSFSTLLLFVFGGYHLHIKVKWCKSTKCVN